MYNACDLNRWTACKMGPIASVDARSKNTIFFLSHLFPFPIGLQKDAVKEAKIKGKGGGSHPRFQRRIGLFSDREIEIWEQGKKFNRQKNAKDIYLSLYAE